MLRIAHLVDDQRPGGVTRYLEFLTNDPAMSALARHEIVPVPRNNPNAARIEADVIVSHLAVTWRGLPGLMMLRARHAGTPLIHVEHSYSAGFVAANVPARRRFMALLRTAYALFDRVVAVSNAQAAWLSERGLVSAGALNVIRPCVDLAPFRALELPGGPIRVFGLIGRFDAQKGFDVAIEAFRQLPDADARLMVFGSGPEEPRLRALAQGDARIRFTSFTNDPAGAMRQCDAILMPSRWEPFGIVALEARAAGRALAVPLVDGLRDHLPSASFVCRGRSVRDWAETIALMSGAAPELPARDGGPDAPERVMRLAWFELIEQISGRNVTPAPRLVA